MAKRRSDALYRSICGYVCDVSPKKGLKKGNKFSFKLQVGETETKTTLCFDASKKRKLEEFEASGLPVKIINIQENDEAKRNLFLHEILVGTMSTVTTPDKNEIDFVRKPLIAKFTNIEDIKNLKNGSVINVRGVIEANVVDTVLQKCQDGDQRRMLEGVVVSDYTGSVRITLWEEAIDFISDYLSRERSCYCVGLKDVRVKFFMGTAVLSTREETILMECNEGIHFEGSKCSTDVDVGPTAEEMIDVKSFAYVTQFTLFYICQNCKKKITELST